MTRKSKTQPELTAIEPPITGAITVPIEPTDQPLTIEEQQQREHDTLTAIHDSQIAARHANAVTHTQGSTSPVQSDPASQNKCPKCGNPFLAVYTTLKMCSPCGWRSDQHEMEPYE